MSRYKKARQLWRRLAPFFVAVFAWSSTLATVASRQVGTATSVHIETLESLMFRLGVTSCDLLKIDCEGAEYEILLSSSDALLSSVGSIICEFHPVHDRSPEELVARLKEAGFVTRCRGGPVGFIYAHRSPR